MFLGWVKSRCDSDKHIKSNFFVTLKALRALILVKSCVARLFKFQRNKTIISYLFFSSEFCSMFHGSIASHFLKIS